MLLRNDQHPAKIRFGLVIQGPTNSFGLSGGQFGKGKYSQSLETLTNMDCRQNVLELAQKAIDYFDHVIVSTWRSPGLEKFANSLPAKVDFLMLDDPGGRPGKYIGSGYQESNFYSNNKVRQFFGLEAALIKMQEKSIDVTAKLRTDQNLDLEMLRLELDMLYKSGTEVIFFVPYFLKSVPWAIPDFYLAGNTERFLVLSKFMQTSFEFHANVHRDLFFKGSLIGDPVMSSNVFSMLHRRVDKVTEKEAELIHSLLSFWSSGSFELFQSLTWRNEKVSFERQKLIFKRDEIEIESMPTVPDGNVEIDFIKVIKTLFGLNLQGILTLKIEALFFSIHRKLGALMRKLLHLVKRGRYY